MTVLLWLISIYLATGVLTYFYAVAKTYEATECWSFRIYKDSIGVCTYPKWLMYWMYLLFGKLLRK